MNPDVWSVSVGPFFNDALRGVWVEANVLWWRYSTDPTSGAVVDPMHLAAAGRVTAQTPRAAPGVARRLILSGELTWPGTTGTVMDFIEIGLVIECDLNPFTVTGGGGPHTTTRVTAHLPNELVTVLDDAAAQQRGFYLQQWHTPTSFETVMVMLREPTRLEEWITPPEEGAVSR